MDTVLPTIEQLKKVQKSCVEFINTVSEDTSCMTEYRREMLIACEGLAVMAELYAKMCGISIERVTDTEKWLSKYSRNWRIKNKESELSEIIKMFEKIEKL